MSVKFFEEIYRYFRFFEEIYIYIILFKKTNLNTFKTLHEKKKFETAS